MTTIQELLVRFDPRYFPFLKRAMERIWEMINREGYRAGTAFVQDEVTHEYYSFFFSVGFESK